MVKEAKTEKFVESATNPVQAVVEPLTPAPTPTFGAVVGSGQLGGVPLHVQIEEDGIALIKKLKQAGIDFEVFLRGVYQRVENGLV